MDDAIGEVLGEISKLSLTEDTMIIFTSDVRMSYYIHVGNVSYITTRNNCSEM